MKKITFLFIYCILCTIIANAGLKRAGFAGTQIAGVDYTSVQAAQDAATTLAGDTIQVYPGVLGNLVQTKKLIIIGVGYFTQGALINTNLNAITSDQGVDIGQISIGSTSGAISGSEYHGIKCNVVLIGNIGTTINNISFIRCNINNFYPANTSPVSSGSISNLKFKQCYNTGNIVATTSTIVLSVLIENTIFSGPSNIFSINTVWSTSSTFFVKNCISSGASVNFGNFSVLTENCIFPASTGFANIVNTVFNNCVFDAAPVVAGTGNIFNANTGTGNVFVGYPTIGAYTNDSRWALKAGSVAIGAGTGGVDCGIYGGATPYKLSGIPAIPAFYKLTAPSTSATTNPYQITFSVRSNN